MNTALDLTVIRADVLALARCEHEVHLTIWNEPAGTVVVAAHTWPEGPDITYSWSIGWGARVFDTVKLIAAWVQDIHPYLEVEADWETV